MFDKHAEEAILAEAELKAEARGEARGEARERSRNEETSKRRAEYLRSQNVPENIIAEMLAVK